MSSAILTSEPRAFIAGETLTWSKSFANYPATVWTLKYSSRGPGTAPTDITATADGEDFLVDFSSTYTAALTPAGTWRLLGWVEKGSEKHFVYDRDVVVIAAPASGTLETRSTAKIIVDNIDAYLQQIKTGGTSALAVASYKIADRETQHYTLDELVKLRTYFWNIYVSEKRKGKEFRNIKCAF